MKEKYDAMESRFYVERLNRITPAQKTLDLQKHQSKFDKFKESQEQKADQTKTREADQARHLEMKLRNIKLNKLERVNQFNERWETEGLENQAKNLKVQRERERKDREFKIRQIRRVDDTDDKARVSSQKEMVDQISKFEGRFLANQDKSTDIDDPYDENFGGNNILNNSGGDKEKSFGPVSMAKDGGNMMSAMLNNISSVIKNRERELHSEFARKERDKRRRKMIVDQSKAQKDIEIKRKEKLLVDKLIQESKQEEEIRYEMWRNKTCKDVICENRSLRENQYQEQAQQITVRETHREKELLKELESEFSENCD